MDDRATVFLVALALVAAVMLTMHEQHYRKRKLIVFDSRLRALEAIVLEDRSL